MRRGWEITFTPRCERSDSSGSHLNSSVLAGCPRPQTLPSSLVWAAVILFMTIMTSKIAYKQSFMALARGCAARLFVSLQQPANYRNSACRRSVSGRLTEDSLYHKARSIRYTVTEEIIGPICEAIAMTKTFALSRNRSRLLFCFGRDESRAIPESTRKQRQHFLCFASSRGLAQWWDAFYALHCGFVGSYFFDDYDSLVGKSSI